MTKTEPAHYRTAHWWSYRSALKQRGSLLIWLDKDLASQGVSTGGSGQPAMFSDAAIQFCLMVKVLFGLPLRQTIRIVEYYLNDWLRLAGA